MSCAGLNLDWMWRLFSYPEVQQSTPPLWCLTVEAASLHSPLQLQCRLSGTAPLESHQVHVDRQEFMRSPPSASSDTLQICGYSVLLR